MGVLALTWFATGIVMHFYASPATTRDEWLRSLGPPIADMSTIGIARVSASIGAPVRHVQLQRLAGRVVYRVYPLGQDAELVDAHTGDRIPGITPPLAVTIAEKWIGNGSHALASRLITEPTALYNPRWPLPAYRVRLDDWARTDVYVAAATGEVVIRAGRRERISRYVGSLPHMLDVGRFATYPTSYILTLQVLAGSVVFLAITGLLYGVWRWQADRKISRRLIQVGRQPRPPRALGSVHLTLGLVLGAFVILWSASGMLETYPGGALSKPTPAPEVPLDLHSIVPEAELRRLAARQGGSAVLGYEFTSVGPVTGFRAVLANGREVLLDAQTGRRLSPISSALAQMIAHQHIRDSATILSTKLLTEADHYYFSFGGNYRPFPVYRVLFADRDKTALYVEAATGKALMRSTKALRLRRWAGSAIHTLNFPFLLRHPNARHILIVLIMSGGVALSTTGIWLGIRSLRPRAAIGRGKE